MNVNILANLMLAELSPAIGSFVIVTVASAVLLWIIPPAHRHHVRKLATYCHELCHGIASLATGGKFHRFYVHSSGGGLSLTSGGNQKIITSAGYIGTILLGAIFLARTVDHMPLIVVLQIIAALLAVSTIKAGDLHTVAVGIIASAVIGLCTLWPNEGATQVMMNLMGVILIWHGAEALKVLLKLSARETHTGSDAEAMAAMTGRHPLHWALAFCGIAVVILLILVKHIT